MRQDYQPKDKWTVDDPDLLKAAKEDLKVKPKFQFKIRWILLFLLMLIGGFYSLFHHQEPATTEQPQQAQATQPKEVHIPLNLPHESETQS